VIVKFHLLLFLGGLPVKIFESKPVYLDIVIEILDLLEEGKKGSLKFCFM
jgi:hypothetical protein